MNNNKGFSSISTPDGQFRMWIPRPTASGRVICNCGFALKSHLPFVDAVDALDYLQVDEVRQIDQDFSILAISFLNASHECMLKMIEDIPELMEQYLVNT